MFLKKEVLILALAGLSINCFSQNADLSVVPKSVIVIQPQLSIGKLLKIYPQFPVTGLTIFSEVNVALQTTGSKEWHQLYHYPKVGIALIHGSLGNNTVLGQNISFLPNLSFETHTNKRWTLQTKCGFGFSYFTKHYDITKNTTNNVIGTSVTNITFLNTALNYKVSENLQMNVGISMFHFSNGHYRLPNVGANIPSVNIGLSYFPKAVPGFYKHDSITKPTKKILINFLLGYGRHEFGSATQPTGGPRYPVVQAGLYLSKRVRRISNVHAGLFFTYYTDFYDFIINQEFFDEQQRLKSSVVTIFAGHEFMIGKFGLITQMGFNIYTPFKKKLYKSEDNNNWTSLYISNKIGVQYYIFDPTVHARKNVYFGLYIKTISASADFAQAAVGYTF